MKKTSSQSNITQVWRPVSVCLSVLLGVAMGLLPAQQAHGQACSTGLGASIDRDFPVAHVNDIITVTKVKVFTSLGDCTVTNGKAWLILPDNTATQIMSGFSFTEGGSAECTGPASGSPCLPINYAYKIKATDVNTPLSFMTPNSNVCNHAATPNFIFFLATAEANAVSTSPDIPQACNNKGVQIVHPCIQVVKQCAYPAGTNCFAAGANINFTGYVTNCGDVQLSATVVDSRTLLGLGLTDLSGFPLIQPLTLAPNGFVAFKGSFTPTLAETCAGRAANTITVRGTDNTAIGGPNASVTNQTTVSCDICVNPCLTVTKLCTDATIDGPQTVSGVLANCGNIAITNIVISDNIYGSITTIASLAAGASTNYSKTFTATLCGFTTNIVTAAGTTACGAPIAARATNTCLVDCPPCINVVKLVACFDTNNICGPFGKTATGVKGDTQLPAFCYSITLSNCGRIALTNVTVNDDKLGNLTTKFFASPATQFPVGGTITFTTNHVSLAVDTTNTVTAIGQSALTSQSVTNADKAAATAIALVIQASVSCNMQVTSPDDVDGIANDAHISLRGDGNPHSVTFTITATSGNAPLANVTISSPVLAGLGCSFPPFSMAANSSSNRSCTVPVNCANIPAGFLTNVAVITAQADTSSGVCAHDANGLIVQVVSTNSGTPCAVVIECVPPPCIDVTKTVACYLGTNAQGGDVCGPFGPEATGMSSGTNFPAFCYSITVSNCGDVNLTNVIVHDDHISIVTNFPTTLAAHQSVNHQYTVSWSTNTFNTVNASGQSVRTGDTNTDFASALARVIPITLTCEMSVNPTNIPNDGLNHDVTFTSTLCNVNTGGVALANITFTSAYCSGSVAFLPAGACTNVSCTVSLNCSNAVNGKFTNTMTVTGYIDTTTGACATNINGQPITVSSMGPRGGACEAVVECIGCQLSVMKTACILPEPCPCVLGYPFASANPRTSVIFNESECLAAFAPNIAGPNDTINVWYTDEHALTLGVRQVIVKNAGGSTTNNYPVTPLNSVPDSSLNPQVGTTALTGPQAGTDLAERPMWPSLFITDITNDPNSRSNDWQYGGTPIAPHAIFGTWKGAVRVVDNTVNPPAVTITPDPDPLENGADMDGGDPAPAGSITQKYGAEARWNIADLIAAGVMSNGHIYRVQFMVHDGDQNKSGGDVGENCATVALGAQAPPCPPPPVSSECTGGAVALTIKYTGADINAPTVVKVTGSQGATITYNLPHLLNGDILTSTNENGYTIDAVAHGDSRLGTTVRVDINNTYEVFHTSCSCRNTPETNLKVCNPMCLDSSSPDNATGTKGPPSPLWTLVAEVDPTLGARVCSNVNTNNPGGTNGTTECITVIPSLVGPDGKKKKCDGDVQTFQFVYVGGGCTNMQNTQKAKDVKCETFINAPNASPVRIRVTDKHGGKVYLDTGTPANVQLNDIVTASAGHKKHNHFEKDIVISIYDAGNNLIERVQFKTDDCKKLDLGDIYGGIKIAGIDSTGGGPLSMGVNVLYTYTIKNEGASTLTGVTVVDDVLGVVPGSPIASIPGFGTVVLQQTVMVSDSVTNTVVVTANNGTCTNTAMAAITKPSTPVNSECTGGIVAFLVQYTGADKPAGTTLSFTGNTGAAVNYTFPNGLTNGTILSLPSEADPGSAWTIDASKHGQLKLGTQTTVRFNGVVTEIFHTSCSCRTNNFIPGQPACLDASSPDNPTGVKGEPSPLFFVLNFKN